MKVLLLLVSSSLAVLSHMTNMGMTKWRLRQAGIQALIEDDFVHSGISAHSLTNGQTVIYLAEIIPAVEPPHEYSVVFLIICYNVQSNSEL